uniref:G-protein coupled receptors family 1 profile domain-containing protein n=1 Tax=Romanomermis culicivorax TaxID=13658 RepID=A0A915HY33_ROMCU
MDNTTDVEVSIENRVAGTFFIILSLISIIGNTVFPLLVIWNKKHRDNPTYIFLINLSIADCILSIPIGLAIGIFSIWPDAKIKAELMVTMLLFGWYSSGYFSLLVALTRLLALKNSTIHRNLAANRCSKIYVVVIFVWTAIAGLCFVFSLLPGPEKLVYLRKLYMYNVDLNCVQGLAVIYFNTVHDIFVSVGIIIMNTISISHIRSKVHALTQSFSNSRAYKLEVKLFFQCLITNGLLVLVCFMYTMFFFMGYIMSSGMVLSMNLCWISYHASFPYIYLLTNKDFRAMLMKLTKC